MPQRFLKPGITTSDHWNACSFGAQSFYIRLMTIVDDYGRYDGRDCILLGQCFAMRPDITIKDLAGFKVELISNDLVQCYDHGGKDYIQILRWEERVRGRSKWPAPPGVEQGLQSGKIYFIQAVDSKKIKIGFSAWNVETRLNTLQTGSPEPLALLGAIDGTPADERALHRKFASLRISGEWFQCHDSILEMLGTRSNPQQPAATFGKILLPSPVASSHTPLAIDPSHTPTPPEVRVCAVEVQKPEPKPENPIIAQKRQFQIDSRVTFLWDELCSFYRRPKTSRRDYAEESMLAEIATRPGVTEELNTIKAYRAKLPDGERKFFPQSLTRLIERWQDVLDRARSYQRPQAEKTLAEKRAEAMLQKVKDL